jgi:hypothetical protein
MDLAVGAAAKVRAPARIAFFIEENAGGAYVLLR